LAYAQPEAKLFSDSHAKPPSSQSFFCALLPFASLREFFLQEIEG
jgi:hypothetical protein